MDDAMKKFLDGVVGVVEANHFEKHALWKANRAKTEERKWVENLSGYGVTVGHLAGRPVFISLITATIDDRKILFIHPTSKVVDWDLIEEWLRTNLPASAIKSNGYVNLVDANNFHNVFPR